MTITVTLSNQRHIAGATAAYLATIPTQPDPPAEPRLTLANELSYKPINNGKNAREGVMSIHRLTVKSAALLTAGIAIGALLAPRPRSRS